MPVKITELGAGMATPHWGTVAQQSGDNLCIVLRDRIAPGASVQVEGEGVLMLAEVCECGQAGEEYIAHMKVEHVLAQSAMEEVRARVKMG